MQHKDRKKCRVASGSPITSQGSCRRYHNSDASRSRPRFPIHTRICPNHDDTGHHHTWPLRQHYPTYHIFHTSSPDSRQERARNPKELFHHRHISRPFFHSYHIAHTSNPSMYLYKLQLLRNQCHHTSLPEDHTCTGRLSCLSH